MSRVSRVTSVSVGGCEGGMMDGGSIINPPQVYPHIGNVFLDIWIKKKFTLIFNGLKEI